MEIALKLFQQQIKYLPNAVSLWLRCPKYTVVWRLFGAHAVFDLRWEPRTQASLRLGTQQLTPCWLWSGRQAAALTNRQYFLKHNNKAKMLGWTAAKQRTWMLFWTCRIVTVPDNQCLMHWGYEILLCSTCAWLSLISATSIPPFLARSSLLWHATSSASFLFLIISHEEFCVSILHFECLIVASVFCIILHLPAIDFFMFSSYEPKWSMIVWLLVFVHKPVHHAELNRKLEYYRLQVRIHWQLLSVVV